MDDRDEKAETRGSVRRDEPWETGARGPVPAPRFLHPPRFGFSAVVASALAVLGVGYASWKSIEGVGDLQDHLSEFGRGWVLVTVVMHIALSATPFPSEILGVTNGSLHGLWLGGGLNWLGWWAGALLQYGLVRVGWREVGAKNPLERVPWFKTLPVTHPLVLILGRQLPFGFHAVNTVAAVAGVSATRMAACAAVSNVPYALATAAVGAGLTAAPTCLGERG